MLCNNQPIYHTLNTFKCNLLNGEKVPQSSDSQILNSQREKICAFGFVTKEYSKLFINNLYIHYILYIFCTAGDGNSIPSSVLCVDLRIVDEILQALV